MKAWLLEILACPACKELLEFDGSRSSSRLVRGAFRCSNNHLYQIKEEIPILKDPKLSEKEFVWRVEFPDIERYDKITKEYLSYLPEGQKKADKMMIDEIANITVNERLLLDVASGMGTLLLVLSQQIDEEKNILGIDVDETPLRGAKLKLEEQKTANQVSLCVMDGKHLAIKPQKLQCVTSYFGFDNIPDTKKAFQEVSRILTPKGRLVFTTISVKEGSKSLALAEKLGYGAIITESRLTQTLGKTGFKVDFVEEFYSGKWPHNPMDRLPLEDEWYSHSLVLAHKR